MPLPIDLNKDVAIGISLPIEAGRNGYFNQTHTTLTQVGSNLINLLLTIPGERYMQPTFGSKLHEYIFEQFDDHIEEGIIDSITRSVEEWLPYVQIHELTVIPDEDYHKIYVSLVVFLRVDPETLMEIKFRNEGPEVPTVVVDSVTEMALSTYKAQSDKSPKQIYDSIT